MTPCAGCPSPILEGAPRVTWERNPEGCGWWHPGCWAAEQRRTEPPPDVTKLAGQVLPVTREALRLAEQRGDAEQRRRPA